MIIMGKDKILILVYFLSIVVYGITEIIMIRKFSNQQLAKQEKSFMLFVVPFYISVYLPPLENILRKNDTSIIFIVAGFLLLYSAIITRICTYWTIGSNFSVTIQAKSEAILVVNGIYKYVRHPLYFTIFLISASGSIIFSCQLMWISILFTFIGILIRIKKEESLLVKRYPEYVQYQKSTKKLIPWIF